MEPVYLRGRHGNRGVYVGDVVVRGHVCSLSALIWIFRYSYRQCAELRLLLVDLNRDVYLVYIRYISKSTTRQRPGRSLLEYGQLKRRRAHMYFSAAEYSGLIG